MRHDIYEYIACISDAIAFLKMGNIEKAEFYLEQVRNYLIKEYEDAE